MATQDSRILLKRSSTSGVVPTVPSSSDHTDGTWIATDIYKGELFVNLADDEVWTRSDNGVLHIGGYKKLDIATADVLTLGSTPVQFGITVPTGYIPVVVGGVFVQSTYNSAAYATNTDLAVRSVGGSNNVVFSSSVLGFTADIFRNIQFTAPTSGLLYVSGADLEVYVPSGDPTTGNSDISIILPYRLIKIA